MPSDSSTLKDSDIDLGWDEVPSSPSAAAQASSPAGGAVRASSSARSARLASTLRDAAKVPPRRLSPPPKPSSRPPVPSVTPRPVIAAKPPPPFPSPSATPKGSGPRYSLPPVSVPPRPGSSSPSYAPPSELHVEIEVTESAIPRASQLRQEVPAAPPAAALQSDAPLATSELHTASPAATLDSDFQLATRAPASIGLDQAHETSTPAPAPSEWPDAGVDSLGPSQLDALPTDSIPPFRDHGPRRAWLAAGAVACVGLLWFIAGANPSPQRPTAELSTARKLPAASPPPVPVPAPAASEATAVTPSPSGGTAGTTATNAAVAIPVAVHVSPPGAFLFEAGRHLGRGDVTVPVVPGTKITLVAQLRGYRARTVVLDGSYTSVNIALRRATAIRGPTPREKPQDHEAASSSGSAEGASKDEVTPPSELPSAPSSPSSSDPSAPSASSDATKATPAGDIGPL